MPRPDAIKVEALNRVAKESSRVASRQQGSIVAFAQRHGWEVSDQDAIDYLTDVILTKDDRVVRLSLWPGRSGSIALATINHVQLSQAFGFPLHQRVERYLTGTECVCVPDPDLYHYEQTPDPGCQVHGAES